MSDSPLPKSPDSRVFEDPLDAQQIALRDLFVNEYMKDFDPFQACIRVGFIHSFAVDWAPRFMKEVYVQRKIAELTRRPSVDTKIQEIEDKALLENTLREAMQRGPYAGRIAAARAFAEMKGWSKPDGGDAEAALVDLFRDIATKVPV